MQKWKKQLKERKELITKQKDKLEIDINKISKLTQEKLNTWISNPKNVVSWDNINKECNKIIITKQDSSELTLSNIQVWGTGVINDKEIYKNWAKHTKPTEFDNGIGAKVTLTDATNSKIDELIGGSVTKYGVNDPGLTDYPKSESFTNSVKCDPGYTMTNCACITNGSTKCNGSKYEDNSCIAYPKILSSENKYVLSNDEKKLVTAKAVCVKMNTPQAITTHNTTGTKQIVESACKKGTGKLIDCNCISSNYSRHQCKGTNIENNICYAYKNKDYDTYDNDTITAQAVCAPLTDTIITHTTRGTTEGDNEYKSKRSKDGTYKSISTCDYNQTVIGCNGYMRSSKLSNSDDCTTEKDCNIYNTIKDINIDSATNSCIVESDYLDKKRNDENPLYADATCAQFGISKTKCVNDKLYSNTTGSDNDELCNVKSNGSIELELHTYVKVDKIILYNINFNKLNADADADGNNIHPIQIELKGFYNNTIQTYNTTAGIIKIEDLENDQYMPNGVQYSDLNSIKNKGSSEHFKGWGMYDNNNYYCRFIKDENDRYPEDPNEAKLKLNCINPLNPSSIIYSNIVGHESANKIGYLRNERNHENNSTDYCRCVDNTLKCSSIIKEEATGTLSFSNNLFKPNNSSRISDNTCNNYNGSNGYPLLKDYDKINPPSNCSTILPDINPNSIDASFYNPVNDRYYIFKNIRIDNNPFVLFCEVKVELITGKTNYIDKFKSTIEYDKYPQIMSSKYWPGLSDVFCKHINTIFNGSSNDVYFVSGEKIVRFDLTMDDWGAKPSAELTNGEDSSFETWLVTDENSIKDSIKNISYGYCRMNDYKNITITYIANNITYVITPITSTSNLNSFEVVIGETLDEQYIPKIKALIPEIPFTVNSILSFPNHLNNNMTNILFIFVDNDIYIYNQSLDTDSIKQVSLSNYYDDLKWDLPLTIDTNVKHHGFSE